MQYPSRRSVTREVLELPGARTRPKWSPAAKQLIPAVTPTGLLCKGLAVGVLAATRSHLE